MMVVIRADASLQIGSGHVMRCLTLADQLCSRGAEVHFVCREHPGHLCALIEERGYPLSRLVAPTTEYHAHIDDTFYAAWLAVSWQQDAEETVAALPSGGVDRLIVDHYAIDRRWEKKLRPHVGRIMVIDDLADRAHDCDLILDQNVYDNMEYRYDKLVIQHCRMFLGPRYALLRPEFTASSKDVKNRDGTVKRILVFFGGSDLTNETTKTLLAIKSLGLHDIAVDVIVGEANPYKDQVKELCSSLPDARFHCQVDNMAQLMTSADLSVGAGGVTAWERMAMQLPTLAIAVADNQVEGLKLAARFKWLRFLGLAAEVTVERLRDEIFYAIQENLHGKFVFIEVSASLGDLIDSLLED